MTPRDPVVLLRHLLDVARDAVDLAHGHACTDLDGQIMLRCALTQCVVEVGRIADQVPAAVRLDYPAMPWIRWSTLGERSTREYWDVDLGAA
jgi:uncharacterized protein with HEPN domain